MITKYVGATLKVYQTALPLMYLLSIFCLSQLVVTSNKSIQFFRKQLSKLETAQNIEQVFLLLVMWYSQTETTCLTYKAHTFPKFLTQNEMEHKSRYLSTLLIDWTCSFNNAYIARKCWDATCGWFKGIFLMNRKCELT